MRHARDVAGYLWQNSRWKAGSSNVRFRPFPCGTSEADLSRILCRSDVE